MVEIDIIVVTHGRPVLLEKCLASLRRALTEVNERICIRVLIGVNDPNPESIPLLKRAFGDQQGLKFEFTCFADRLSPPAARNRLVALARGDWLFFIDDDASIKPDFFSIFIEVLKRYPNASAIGGPNLTPPDSNVFQKASGGALTSRFGASGSCVRYRPRTTKSISCGEESLILCNLFISRKAMAEVRFPDRFVCNEENWILQDLLRFGHVLIYEPSLSVWHERRSRPLAFMAQIHKYGMGRGQNMRARPATVTLMHLTPALCLLASLATLVTFIWFPIIGKTWLFLLLAYIVVWSVATIRLKRHSADGIKICLYSALLFPVIHVTYGAGVLRGLTLRNE
jgi:glycosyltransferase involved in cell wall biosynthesis